MITHEEIEGNNNGEPIKIFRSVNGECTGEIIKYFCDYCSKNFFVLTIAKHPSDDFYLCFGCHKRMDLEYPSEIVWEINEALTKSSHGAENVKPK